MSGEKRKFAVFDIDGTIFRWQLYHELFDELSVKGYIDDSDRIRVLDARNEWATRHSGFMDYENVLVEVMERQVIGLDESLVKDLAKEILASKGHRTYAYTRNLMHRLRESGYFIIALSGSYQQLVEAFAELHHIDLAIGTNYALEDGKFIRKERMVFGNKGPILRAAIDEHDLTLDESYAVGDSGSDSAMLELVAHPIAFNPDDRLFEIAKKHGWKVVIERKNMIYELEEKDGTYLLASANPR